MEIGSGLRREDGIHIVGIRSTFLPGTMRSPVIPVFEETSGKTTGTDFGICDNPEFLSEGTAIADFRNPPMTIIGATDACSGDMVQSLYEGLPGPIIRRPTKVGGMVKTPIMRGVPPRSLRENPMVDVIERLICTGYDLRLYDRHCQHTPPCRFPPELY